MKYSCPHCGRELKSPASVLGSMGRGKSKARTTEQARRAALARWHKKSGAKV